MITKTQCSFTFWINAQCEINNNLFSARRGCFKRILLFRIILARAHFFRTFTIKLLLHIEKKLKYFCIKLTNFKPTANTKDKFTDINAHCILMEINGWHIILLCSHFSMLSLVQSNTVVCSCFDKHSILAKKYE